jgi:pilus assembly protein CpaB
MAPGSKRTSRIFILLGLIIILILLLVVVFMKDRIPGLLPGNKPVVTTLATATPPADVVDIVITSQAVSRGAEFTEAVLTTMKYPKNSFVEGTFFGKIKDVVGKKAKFDFPAQMIITSSMLVDTLGGSFTAFSIPKGLVAISIPMQDRVTAVSFGLEPGDHINVIATLLFIDLDQDFQSQLPNKTGVVTAPNPGGTAVDLVTPPELSAKIENSTQGKAVLDPTLNQPVYLQPSEPQRPRMVSQTLLQDVIVLRVGNFNENYVTSAPSGQATPTPTPTSAPGAIPTASVEPKNPDIITLLVSPQDAVTLNYLVYAGAKLTLVLRGAGDDQRVQTDAVTLQYLMDTYVIPIPAKQPYGLQPSIDTLAVPDQYKMINATPTPLR